MSERSFSEESKAEIRVYRAEARFLRALYYHAMDMLEMFHLLMKIQ